MSKGNFVVIDMESMNGKALGACEVGMVKYSNGHLVDTFHSYIKPYDVTTSNVVAKRICSHISQGILDNAPTFDKIHENMLEFIEDNLLVCYNKGTDMNYLYYNEKKAGKSGLCTRQYLDMNMLFHNSFEQAYNEWFDASYKEIHEALDDAKHEAELFNAYIDTNDYTATIESNYIPEKEKPKKDKSKFDSVSYDADIIEDELVESYDFQGKLFVISGDSSYRSELENKLQTHLGAIKRSDINNKTQLAILGEKVGPSKKEKLLKQKQIRPDGIHIFSQEAVAKLLGIN